MTKTGRKSDCEYSNNQDETRPIIWLGFFILMAYQLSWVI